MPLLCFSVAWQLRQSDCSAGDIFTSLKTIEQEGKAAADLKAGVVRIGSFGASSSIRLLPALIDRFTERYPGIEVIVLESDDRDVEQQLVQGVIDLGVVTLPRLNFETLHLVTDEFVAVLPEGHELAAHDPVDIRELAKHNFILRHSGSAGLVRRLFDRAGVELRVTHDLGQIWSILDFVRRRQGVSIIASLALPDSFPGIVKRSVIPRGIRSIGLACRDEGRLSPAARAFWRIARDNENPASLQSFSSSSLSPMRPLSKNSPLT